VKELVSLALASISFLAMNAENVEDLIFIVKDAVFLAVIPCLDAEVDILWFSPGDASSAIRKDEDLLDLALQFLQIPVFRERHPALPFSQALPFSRQLHNSEPALIRCCPYLFVNGNASPCCYFVVLEKKETERKEIRILLTETQKIFA
jgi:hypothetical protein